MFDSSHYPTFYDDSKHLDFAFHEIFAPSVDSFEYDLDLISQNHDFNAFQLELTQVNSAYNHTIPTHGPGSAITFSSESSSQDTFSCYSEPTSTYSFPLDVDMDFQRIHVDDFPGPQSSLPVLDDPRSFGTLPPTPPRSPQIQLTTTAKSFEKPYVSRTSFSDYSPPTKRNSISSDYYNHLSYNTGLVAQSTISPSHISTSSPVIPSTTRVVEELKGDPRKKYKCPVCPRGHSFF